MKKWREGGEKWMRRTWLYVVCVFLCTEKDHTVGQTAGREQSGESLSWTERGAACGEKTWRVLEGWYGERRVCTWSIILPTLPLTCPPPSSNPSICLSIKIKINLLKKAEKKEKENNNRTLTSTTTNNLKAERKHRLDNLDEGIRTDHKPSRPTTPTPLPLPLPLPPISTVTSRVRWYGDVCPRVTYRPTADALLVSYPGTPYLACLTWPSIARDPTYRKGTYRTFTLMDYSRTT